MSKKQNKRFICVGESPREDIQQGLCGDTHTLQEWIRVLYGEIGVAYFDGAPNKKIIEYILKNGGKRLKEDE